MRLLPSRLTSSITLASLLFIGAARAQDARSQDDGQQLNRQPQPAAETNQAAAKSEPKPGEPKLKPFGIKVTISKETTYITEPLRKDGYPDYIRYINDKLSEGVTPDNNAVVLLMKTLGHGELGEKYSDQFFKMLGIEALPKEGDYFTDWATFSKGIPAKDWQAPPRGDTRTLQQYWEELDDVAREQPWTSKDFPALAKWLAANDKHIDQIVAASKRPRMYAPLIASDENQSLVSVLMPVVQSNRKAGRALVTRAMYRAGNNDFEGALEDLMASHRLARLTARGFTMIEGLVAIAIDHIAMDAEGAMLAADTLTAEQRATLRKALEQLPPIRSMADMLDRGERLMYADSVCWIARTGASGMKNLIGTVSGTPQGMAEVLVDLAGNVLVDWDVPLRIGMKWYDRYVEVARIDEPKKRLEALAAIEADIKRTAAGVTHSSALWGLVFSPRFSASQKMGDIFISLLLPALNAALNAEHRNHTRHTLLKLALAAVEYRDEQKQFPDKLDDLAPKHIDKIPLDPMWGEPFNYRKTDDGFVLYALGMNGRDDLGRPSNEFDNADDLVIAVGAKKQ